MKTCELEQMLEDIDFTRFLRVVARELAAAHCMSIAHARSMVLSGLGDPVETPKIFAAWTGGQRGLAMRMVRCRAIDLLRNDRRRARHQTLPDDLEELQIEVDEREALERSNLVQVLLAALECFAAKGEVQRRQVELLRRYTLEDATYPELSAELGASIPALRVRVHKAFHEFQHYLKVYLRHRDPQLSQRISVK